MNDDNQVLIEEITERIKIDWKESIRGLLSCWSDDELRRFKSAEQFVDYILVWYNFGNVSLDIKEELGVASIFQIGDMIYYVTVVLMPSFNESTFKVYLPKEDFIRLFEAEKEKREI
ncbi:MAG: hypothetical protein GX453_04340 [Lactococcus chungangensis]|uniref:Uncharacterized protein n=1 Tax=Pseudolactococcus chungangensis TaxID=451457 RepID=A0A847J3T6_9LACT|nr:hypothetical protein [Lactococcus chungangensis]